MHLYLIITWKIENKICEEWESKIYKRDAIMKYLWRKDGSIETWYPTHQYSRARSSSEWMSWRKIYRVLFWGYSFVFCFPLFILFFFLGFFFFDFCRLKFLCFPLVYLSMTLSWVHLDPLKLFSSGKGSRRDHLDCGASRLPCKKKFYWT